MSILSEIGAFFLGIGSETLNFLKGAATALASNPQIQAIATQEVQNAETAVTGLPTGAETRYACPADKGIDVAEPLLAVATRSI